MITFSLNNAGKSNSVMKDLVETINFFGTFERNIGENKDSILRFSKIETLQS